MTHSSVADPGAIAAGAARILGIARELDTICGRLARALATLEPAWDSPAGSGMAAEVRALRAACQRSRRALDLAGDDLSRRAFCMDTLPRMASDWARIRDGRVETGTPPGDQVLLADVTAVSQLRAYPCQTRPHWALVGPSRRKSIRELLGEVDMPD